MTFEAILFDCDGVLVDSEPITNGVLCQMLGEAGWQLSPDECMRLFIGKTVRSETARIEAETGRPLTDAWMAEFYARRNARLQTELVAIANAPQAVHAVHALLQGRIACASGADRFKVEMQLAQVGLAPYFAGRIFSGHEMPATKPAPDVYLAAAASVAVPPARCLVVEDTVTGVMAGVAAGATVVGYSPSPVGHGSPDALRSAGALQVMTDMAELPVLLQALRGL
ncbi:HAD family phosphatase [Diaphorobacter sp. JS3050]|uniref:HAD family hydrolase n=1 Tax=Diaphorobacter sp. JS3050 TaxID=2735554 RepID=UPI001552C558|nr:HAD family phosphatase [Diaphorobacter sp. JS3050]QJY31808.1 HAD family phosphatase [Diaphorobacter sp. JS3050]